MKNIALNVKIILCNCFRMRIWVWKRENLSSRFGDNKGADQPVHLRRLISTFAIIILESIVSKLSKFEF